MAGTLFCAVLVVVASVVIGRAAMLALGWRRPEWVAGAVGFAVLVTAAPFLVRLPGRGLTAAIILALVTIACAVVTRRAVPRPAGGESGAYRGDRPAAQHTVALAVVPAVIAMACLPFLFNERTGVLGEGIYTNDQAAQLYWADWLADGFGPQPSAVSVGYPVGPQALAATVSEGTTFNLLDTFNGVLVAVPALTALAALSLLGGLSPLRRGLAAGLTGLPYLGASFLAQSGFKETIMAMFVVALAVVLHLALRREGEEREPPPALAVIGVAAILAAASVFTFSVPGAAWFALAIPVWFVLSWIAPATSEFRSDFRRNLAPYLGVRWLLGAGLLAAGVAALALGPAAGFIDRIDEVQGSSGRLSSPVFPGEALGIWPEGDFRVVRGQVDGSLLATALAGLCVLGAAIALLRRREWGLLSVLGASALVYALARPLAEIHVEAKALCVLAPITMLVTVRWLLSSGEHFGQLARQAVGAVFCALALVSTFLALRSAPVGFNERGSEDLRALAERIEGERVVFLGVDRFAGYWLRGTLAESPGGYVPQDVDGRPEKRWQQGLAMDFDTLSPSKLDNYEFAITTAAGFASTPPVSFAEVAREGDYVLWERSGETPSSRILDEGGEPGAVFGCGLTDPGPGTATVLERPATADQADWMPNPVFGASEAASTKLRVPAGEWSVSLQYHSQSPLTLSVDGRKLAELKPSLEGFYLTGAGRGAFWPAGDLESDGGRVTVEVEAQPPSGLQEFFGVERTTWLGTVAFTSRGEPTRRPLADSCGDYVDHFELSDD